MALLNICHGCLSAERKLSPIEEHANLYRQLLLKKSKSKAKKVFFCWECHKGLANIHAFRLKITQAQSLLCKRKQTMPIPNSLSNLAMLTKIDDYDVVIQEDVKINTSSETVALKKEEAEYYDKKLHVEIDISNVKEEIKYESFDDNIQEFQEAFDDDNGDFENDINDVKEADEELVPIEMLEKKVEIKVQRKRAPLRQKYRTIIMEDVPDKRNLYEIIKVDLKDAMENLEKKRKRVKKKFSCTLCGSGFAQQKFHDYHMRKFHNQKNKYICDICACRFRDFRGVQRHVPKHFLRFQCKLCVQQFDARDKMYIHLKHGPHGRQWECRQCKQRFDSRKRKEFFEHYRNAHGLFVCDHCGRRKTTKDLLRQHIRSRHSDIRCKQCSISFSSRTALKKHNERKHTTDMSERNYCVECDMQFANDLLYIEHVKRSTKHNPKPRIKCPECDKTYSKNIYMRNHFDLEHLKASRHICPVCERPFLNGFRLRTHIKYYHEKMPKSRHHICNYCGKGFNTRRILENHVRTHTGERPFACAHCPAAFAQKQALLSHSKSAHK